MDIISKENGILDLYADNGDLFNNCENYIFPELWSTNINKQRYDIARNNHAKNIKTDVLLMSNSLIKTGYSKADIKACLGRPDYMLEKNIVEYVKDLFDEYIKRTMKPVLHQKYKELNSEIGDVHSALEDLKNVIGDIESVKNNLSVEKSILDIHDEAFKELLEAQDQKTELIGYSYGLRDLDKYTCGAKQEVILVLSPPACGKSSFMVNIIKHMAIRQKVPVLIHSLEMPAKQIMKNIWANALEINSYGIRSGQLSDENLAKIKNFKDALNTNLVIDDTNGVTWQYIETRVRKMRKTFPIEQVMVVVVDYVQIMRNTPEETRGLSEEGQQSLRANGLLELSKKYNLCMIELSQIGRETGKRENKEPTMSDAKGSGAWEANAVICLGLFRPDYFTPDPIEDGVSLKGLCKIKILKNRYGETGNIFTRFKGQFSAFENYNPEGLSSNNESEAF